MSESFEQLLEESLKTISTGEVVTGTVINVKEDEIALNIGYKADGIVAKREYTSDMNADLTQLVHVGDEMEVKVLKVNDGEGQVQLSYRRLQAERSSKVLEAAFENKEVLSAKVTQITKGGMNVEVDGTKVFIPASLASDVFEKDLNKFLGQTVDFVLIEYDPKKRRVIGDCKQLLASKKAEAKAAALAKLVVGERVTGTVKNITDFGVFIDLGGIDGLLHISEMSWSRVEKPKDLFKAGDEVEVCVKSIDGEKIGLSRKFDETNPWADAATKYAVGNVVTGVVARMTDFGAFVELEKGVDALLHVSQISKEHIAKPADVLSVGQEIEAVVLDLKEADKKISISMKALIEDAPAQEAEVATTVEE